MPENKVPDKLFIPDTDPSFVSVTGVQFHSSSSKRLFPGDIEYIKATSHNHVKAKLLKMIRIHTVPDDYDLEDQKEWLADYLKREGLGFLVEGEE